MAKSDGNRPLGTPRRKWEYNIKTNITGNGLDSSGSGEEQVECSCQICNDPSICVKHV